MATPSSRLATGSVFANSFRVIRPLGEVGERGGLYLVTRVSTGQQCLLRVLPAKVVANDAGRSDFEAACNLRAGVGSAHVVELLDVGIDKASGAPWFAMAAAEPKSLEEYAGSLASHEDVLEALAQVSHAVGAMTDAGSVHGALDPRALVVEEGTHYGSPFTVKLLDFWSPRLLRAHLRPWSPTPAMKRWCAPEALDTEHELTPAADVWSFGLLAFFLLTGNPFGDEIARESVAAASERAQALNPTVTLPEGFDAWFARCVARAPEDRFANVDEAIEGLAPLLGGEATDTDAGAEVSERPARRPAVSTPPLATRWQALPSWVRSSDVLIPVGLLAVLLVALGVRQVRRARTARNPAATTTASPANPANPAPTNAPPTNPAAMPVVELTDEIIEDLVRRIGTAPAGSPAWVTVMADDPGAAARGEKFREMFRRAGWNPRPLQRHTGRLRPGYFLFAADVEPPEYVSTLGGALRATGLISEYLRGYRDFYRERSAGDPNFRGFAMEADQTFVLVVGRSPP